MSTTITAPIGPTKWRLAAIGTGSAPCAHCGRNLKHTYTVVDPAGTEMILGRACVKKVTGWNLEMAEATRILRIAARNAEHLARWNTFRATNPDDAALIERDIVARETDYARRSGRGSVSVPAEWNGAPSGAGPAAEVRDWIAEGRPADMVVSDWKRRRREFSWAR